MKAKARRSYKTLEARESREQKAQVHGALRHGKAPRSNVIYVKAIASIHCLHSGARQADLAEMDEEKYRGLFQSSDTVVHLGYHHPPGGE